MRARDFLIEFNDVQGAFRWEHLENGAIRGVPTSGRSRQAFDPLTAVIAARGDRDANGDAAGIDRVRAAEALGLSAVEAESIRDASDGTLWKWLDGQMVLDARAEWIREAIAVSAGLESDDIGAVHPLARVLAPAGLPLEPETALQFF